MNDRGYLVEIQYSLLSREKEIYFAPVESATRYTTWAKKQRKTLKEVCAVDGTQDHRESAYAECPWGKDFHVCT